MNQQLLDRLNKQVAAKESSNSSLLPGLERGKA